MCSLETRGCAVAFLFVVTAAIFPVCRFLGARTPKPLSVWGAGLYLALLHIICIYGLLTSTRFDTALAQLTLYTFPASAAVGDTLMMQGFASLPDLAVNYVRYIICFGGLDALFIAGIICLVVPGRAPAHSQRSR